MTFIASVDAMSNFLRQEAPDLWRPGWSCGIRCNFIPTSQEYRKVPTEIVATLPYIYTYNIYICCFNICSDKDHDDQFNSGILFSGCRCVVQGILATDVEQWSRACSHHTYEKTYICSTTSNPKTETHGLTNPALLDQLPMFKTHTYTLV